MKKFLLYILGVLFYTSGFCQAFIVSGKVMDKATGLALPGSSVYAENTTYGVATDAQGNFQLRLPQGGYNLIVTFTGYETAEMRISNSGVTENLTIQLKQKSKSLEEVSVIATSEVKNGWEKYGTFFKENFIGKTDYALQTEIKNPEVLKFFFSKKRNRLKVTAEEPPVLVNNALGYLIKYAIDSFTYEYTTNTNTITGYPLFEEMKGTPEQMATWKANREKTYNGSIVHFMRSLFNKQLEKDGFEIQFLVQQGDNQVAVPVKTPYIALNYIKNDSLNTAEFFPEKQDIAVFYKNAKPEKAFVEFDPATNKNYQLSYMHITPGMSITIESNGYFFDQADVIVNGYWGFEKVANMLPYDYTP